MASASVTAADPAVDHCSIGDGSAGGSTCTAGKPADTPAATSHSIRHGKQLKVMYGPIKAAALVAIASAVATLTVAMTAAAGTEWQLL